MPTKSQSVRRYLAILSLLDNLESFDEEFELEQDLSKTWYQLTPTEQQEIRKSYN